MPAPSKRDHPAELLAAADYIREHGWTRGRFKVGRAQQKYDPDAQLGEVCLMGAYFSSLNRRMGEKRVGDIPGLQALLNVTGVKQPKTQQEIPANHRWYVISRQLIDWNDNKKRTKEDVITALEQAAADLKQDG